MVKNNRIKLYELQESFSSLSEKYLLTVRDIEFLFIEAIAMEYGSEDIEITHEGIRITKNNLQKYHNISFHHFKNILAYFEEACIQRSIRKNSNFLERLLAQNNYILYGKILQRDSYGYTIIPMKSKTETLQLMNTIHISKINSVNIPEHIEMIPIEILVRTKQYEKYRLSYKALFMSKKLCDFHLNRLVEELQKNYRIYIILKGQHYDNIKGIYYIKDVSKKKELHFKIINYIVNYFQQFGVKVIIKTTIIRK